MTKAKTTAATKYAAAFEAWDDDAEQAAIDEVVATSKVDHIIVEGRTFVGRFTDGKIVEASLAIPFDKFLELDAALPPMEQFSWLMDAIGGGKAVEELKARSTLDSLAYISLYFETFQKIQKAALGE